MAPKPKAPVRVERALVGKDILLTIRGKSTWIAQADIYDAAWALANYLHNDARNDD